MVMTALPNMASPSSPSTALAKPYHTSWKSAVEAASLAVILVFSILGNATVSVTLVRRGLLAHPSNRLVLSLTASNLAFALLVLPGVLASTVSETSWSPFAQFDKEGNWDATWWCQFSAFAELLISTASSSTLAAIAIDRYYAIVKPMKYTRTVTPSRTQWSLLGIWVLALACAFPPCIGWSKFTHHPGQHACVVDWAASLSFSIVFFIIAVITPLCLMCQCYYAILQVARTKCRRIHVGILADLPDAVDCTTAGTVSEEINLPLHNEPIPQTDYPWKGSGCRPTKTSTEGEEDDEEDDEQHIPAHRTCSLNRLTVLGSSMNPYHNSEGRTTQSNLLRRSTSLVMQLANKSTCQESSSGVRGCASSQFDRSNLKPTCYSSQVPGIAHSQLLSLPVPTTGSPGGGGKLSLNIIDRLSTTSASSQYMPFRTDRQSSQNKKSSFSQRKTSWGWTSSTTPPIKGFSTVFLVITAFLMTWSPTVVVALWEIHTSWTSSGNMVNYNLIPDWLHVLAFWSLSAGTITYPLLYGVYNRSIRKQLFRAALCAKGLKYEQNQRRPSKWSNFSDYSALRGKEKNLWTGSTHATIGGPIELIYTQTSMSSSTPRKPSQDSGAVMMSADEDDIKEPRAWRKLLRKKSRRMSAPSVLWNCHQLHLSDHHHRSRVRSGEVCKSSPTTRQGSMRQRWYPNERVTAADAEVQTSVMSDSPRYITDVPEFLSSDLISPPPIAPEAEPTTAVEIAAQNSNLGWCVASLTEPASDDEEEENTLHYSQCQYTFTVQLQRCASPPNEITVDVCGVPASEPDNDLRSIEYCRKPLRLAVPMPTGLTSYFDNDSNSSKLCLPRIAKHGDQLGVKKTEFSFGSLRQSRKTLRSQSCGYMLAVIDAEITTRPTAMDEKTFSVVDVRDCPGVWRKTGGTRTSCTLSQPLYALAPSCHLSVDEGIEKDCIT